MGSESIVIGISGNRPGCGKTEMSHAIYRALNKKNVGAYLISLASGLKELVADYGEPCGPMTDSREWKDKPHRFYSSKSNREILVTVGSAVRKALPDFFANRIRDFRYNNRNCSVPQVALVPDVRYLNEAKLCDLLVYVNRDPQLLNADESEEIWNDPGYQELGPDVFHNEGSFLDLESWAYSYVEEVVIPFMSTNNYN